MSKRVRLPEISGDLAEDIICLYEGLGYKSFREFLTVLNCQHRMGTDNLPAIGTPPADRKTPKPTSTYVNPRGGYDDFDDDDE